MAAGAGRMEAVGRDGTGVQDFGGLDADLSTGWAIGVELSAVDEYVRGYCDRAPPGANAPGSPWRWPGIDAASGIDGDPAGSSQAYGVAL